MKFSVSFFFALISLDLDTTTGQQCINIAQKEAGSTTVYPYVVPLAAAYPATCPGYSLSASEGGSSKGILQVCGGDSSYPNVDIGGSSRLLKSSEINATASNGYTYTCNVGAGAGKTKISQLSIANDAIVFITKASGDAKTCLTKVGCLSKDQLRWMFSSYTVTQLSSNGWNSASVATASNARTWRNLHAACANTPIHLAGPDTEKFGEGDFLEGVLFTGSDETFRTTGFRQLSTKAAVNTYVAGNGTAIAFNDFMVGRSTPVATPVASVKNSAGNCMAPTTATVQTGTYNPFSRLAYLFVKSSCCTDLKAALGFVKYVISTAGQAIVTSNGGIALSTSQTSSTNTRITSLGRCTTNP